MPILSARRAFWNATQITDGDFSAATELGTLAPGTELPGIDIMTGDGFGFTAAVGATTAPVVMVYGTTAEASVVTAANASPPEYGYLHVINANGVGYTWYLVHPVAAYAVPRQNDRQKEMVAYSFFGENDTPADLTGNVATAATFGAES